jgi:hypothetical protein
MSYEYLTEVEASLQTLVRELGQALERGLLEFREPADAARPFYTRHDRISQEIDQRIAREQSSSLPGDPEGVRRQAQQVVQLLTALKTRSRQHMDEMVARAQRAHDTRPQAQRGLEGNYNELVGKGLSSLVEEGERLPRSQARQAVRSLVNQAFAASADINGGVPSNVKDEITNNLTDWLIQQDGVSQAFVAVQASVVAVAQFLHEKLTINASLKELRDRTASAAELTVAEANAADQHFGALAQRSAELDAGAAERVRMAGWSLSPQVSVSPRLVLDPARGFIEGFDSRIGLRLQKGSATIDLGTRIKITDLTVNPEAGVNPYLNLNLPAQDLQISAGYESQQDAFKLQLNWRF